MTETTNEQNARQAFRQTVLDHVRDLSMMCRWVVDHPGFPVPSVDLFVPACYSVYAWSDAEFGRLAAYLAADGPIEREAGDSYTVARRRFGSVSVEVWWPSDQTPS
jgi:hypothetical protein